MIGSLMQSLAGGQGEGAMLLAAGAMVAAVLLGLGWSLVRWLLPSSEAPSTGEGDAAGTPNAASRARGEAPANGSFAHALSASASDLPDGELCRVSGIPRNLLPLLRARPSGAADASNGSGAAGAGAMA